MGIFLTNLGLEFMYIFTRLNTHSYIITETPAGLPPHLTLLYGEINTVGWNMNTQKNFNPPMFSEFLILYYNQGGWFGVDS